MITVYRDTDNLKKEVNIDDVKDIIIHNPLTRYVSKYASDEGGGMNLTIGYIIKKGETLKMYGLYKPESVTIHDTYSGKTYVYEY